MWYLGLEIASTDFYSQNSAVEYDPLPYNQAFNYYILFKRCRDESEYGTPCD